MTPDELIEHDERWFKRYLVLACLLSLVALVVTIVWVRPGNVSADSTVTDAVKALGAAGVAIPSPPPTSSATS
jgi:hypothetical protein